LIYNFELAIKDEFIKREQKGIEQGLKKGIEKGIEKGMEKGMEQGIKKGITEGKEMGRFEEKIETAKAGLLEGMSIELIKKLTGLEFEKIEKLRKEIKY